MSKPVAVTSENHFDSLLRESKIVVADFWAEWCGPCKAIAPAYEQLSQAFTRPGKVAFTKIDTEAQKGLAQKYGITALPTFMVFKNGTAVETVKGADPRKLQETVRKIAEEADSDTGSGGFGESSGSSTWLGADLPRGYGDITDQIDRSGWELRNGDEGAEVRTLVDSSKPSSLDKSKAKDATADWIESDTDEQLMIFLPFQSTLKVHTIQLTSLPPANDDTTELRPKTIHIYSNRAHIVGFEEAESIPATQSFELKPQDWDTKTGTAKLELRFVKFQNITSLVLFIVDAEGGGDKTRIDRIRIIGESGEKREMGKLQKVGEDQ